MNVILYATILLVLRIVSVYFIVDVIRKQRELRRRPIRSQKAAMLREQMYGMATIALGVNFIPILVDVLTIVGITTRSDTINYVSVVYMFSYAFGTLLLTGIIWRMYRDALK